MRQFFSTKNIVIMMCKSGRPRSVANAELWSNTLTRCCRPQHSVSLLHLSELDFWEVCSKMSNRVFSRHTMTVYAPVPDPVTGRWKRSRSKHAESSARPTHARSMVKITFNKLRKHERQVPQLRLLGRTRIVKSSTNWQSESGTFATALVHRPVVFKITMFL